MNSELNVLDKCHSGTTKRFVLHNNVFIAEANDLGCIFQDVGRFCWWASSSPTDSSQACSIFMMMVSGGGQGVGVDVG